jgi:hypothetical protein
LADVDRTTTPTPHLCTALNDHNQVEASSRVWPQKRLEHGRYRPPLQESAQPKKAMPVFQNLRRYQKQLSRHWIQ